MINITHIISPVKVDKTSDLHVAQPITFKSMRIAKNFARNMNINLLTAQFEEDLSIIPKWFNKSTNLTKSILDLNTFEYEKKYPLINDILLKAYENSNDGDYIIYTNADIALLPNFYNFVASCIHKGLNAFSINKRIISNTYTNVSEIFSMYSEVGTSHLGHDCIIFKREYYPKMILGDICVGIPRIGLCLITNLDLITSTFVKFEDKHVTFHIGNQETWKKKNDYKLHNKEELLKIKAKLINKYGETNVNTTFEKLSNNKKSKI